MSSYSLYRCAVLSVSTSSLDKVLDRNSPIQILRATIHVDGQSYSDGLNMNPEQFYEWINAHPAGEASTEPPDSDTIRQTFRQLKAQGYHQAIVTTPCRELSDTYHMIAAVAGELAGELDIYVFDTGTLCMPEGFFALEALRLLEQDIAPADIVTYLEQLRPLSQIIFSVDSVQHIMKKTVFSRLGGALADWLQIKPILRFQNSKLEHVGNSRTTETALDEIVQTVAAAMTDQNIEAYGLYCGNPALYDHFADKLYQATGLQLPGYPVSPAVGVYIGPNAVGVGIVEKLPLVRPH